jgi:hypothetical protein
LEEYKEDKSPQRSIFTPTCFQFQEVKSFHDHPSLTHMASSLKGILLLRGYYKIQGWRVPSIFSFQNLILI